MAYVSAGFLGSNTPEIQIRRDLHRYPETAFQEYRTASRIAETLDALGYAVRVGAQVMRAASVVNPPLPQDAQAAIARAQLNGGLGRWMDQMQGGLTAVVAEKRFGPGPVLAFRFDMDALTLQETQAENHLPGNAGFASQDPQRMHGCGHDGHVAIGLSLAQSLAKMSGLSGTLRLIFQPAEEGGRGAVPIIDAGVLDDVDFLFVAHLGCFLGSGRLAANASGFLHSSKLRVGFHGTASHAAMAPQLGCNALLVGAAAALNLHAISRVAGEETFINVGRMTAGTTFNIIADQCELLLEVRAETAKGHRYMLDRAEAVIAGAAQMHGVTHEMEIVAQLNGNENHADALAIIDRAARSLPDLEVLESWPIGGGDDASKMIARVHERGGIGAYFIIGSDITAAHHAQNFDFDEASLATGRQVFEAIAVQVLGKA